MPKSGKPEEILRVNNLKRTLRQIGEIVDDGFTENEVQMVFLNEGYFHLLGYSKIGSDLQSEVSIDGGQADYVTTGQQFGSNAAKTTVYEFKNPTRKLSHHTGQLQRYMSGISASYGVLTNGQQFIIYEQSHSGMDELRSIDLQKDADVGAPIIVRRLSSLSVEEQELKNMAEASAEVVADELPRDLWAHPGFSGPTIETFSEYYAEFLFNKLSERR